MKVRNLTTLMLVLLITLSFSLTSCDKDEQSKDLTKTIVTESTEHSDYVGNMAVTGAIVFTNSNYKITVERIDNNTIKIIPEDSNASSFTVDLKDGANGAIVSEDATLGVSFEESEGEMTLSYGYVHAGNTEVFSGGIKQN